MGFEVQRTRFWRGLRGWLLFGLMILVTVLIWLHVRSSIEDNARTRFDDLAVVERDRLLDRMRDYEQVLLGAAGLFNASEGVQRDEWRRYVEALRLHLTLPGIQGIGYAEMVPGRDKKAHEARIRAQGFPNYAISPPGERDVYSSIVYLEPFSGRNLRAFGFDMYAEPVRHAAMQRAADTQSPAWSGKVKLVQEDNLGKPQPGFLVYVPIYAKDKPLRTIEERRAALLGFVYSPFRAHDMLSQLYQNPKRLFELQLYDGSVAPENLLYETAEVSPDARFVRDLPVDIGGVRWTARFSSNANFYEVEFTRLPLILFLTTLALESLLFVTFWMDRRQRRRIVTGAAALERLNREMSLMATLTQLLQNCNREEEAFPILNRMLGELFPGLCGACYLLNHSETQLDRVSTWGALDAQHQPPELFSPEQCWAFRRGQKHHVVHDDQEVRCEHVVAGVGEYVCMPMLTQGKAIGDLYLEQPITNKLSPQEFSHSVELLGSVADTLSLALSSLRLRNSLRDLSIRDALTGLYNRRYMEESLEREIDRARRQGQEIAVVMLDVDHFKQLNDTYGHEAGDAMLKHIADQMKHFRNGSDVVCRFGGEEFVLILPGMDSGILHERLEGLRTGIEQMRVNFEGRILPTTTVSMGVVRFPTDSADPDELIRLADAALYRAKRSGRNRIEWTASA